MLNLSDKAKLEIMKKNFGNLKKQYTDICGNIIDADQCIDSIKKVNFEGKDNIITSMTEKKAAQEAELRTIGSKIQVLNHRIEEIEKRIWPGEIWWMKKT